MNKRIATLFQKYQKGQLNLKEELLLAEMISDPSNSEANQFLKDDFQNAIKSPFAEKREMKHVLHEIHHRIHLRQAEKQKGRVYHLYQLASRVAAILFIPLLVFSFYFFMNEKIGAQQATLLQIVAPQGSRINFELPDGTKGILNSGSKLDYSTVFVANRKIKLTGEAYFDVAHDTKHPFTIDAKGNNIKVVGTKFTLTAWPEENQTELVLEEGKVLFQQKNQDKVLTVLPGQRIIEKEGKLERSEVETWKYTAWKDGRLVFRNDSMEELARRISRWYNVEVEFDKNLPDEYTFRGVFEDDSLEEVLRLLGMTSPIDFKIMDRQLNSDGSYTHKKVIITKK